MLWWNREKFRVLLLVPLSFFFIDLEIDYFCISFYLLGRKLLAFERLVSTSCFQTCHGKLILQLDLCFVHV